ELRIRVAKSSGALNMSRAQSLPILLLFDALSRCTTYFAHADTDQTGHVDHPRLQIICARRIEAQLPKFRLYLNSCDLRAPSTIRQMPKTPTKRVDQYKPPVANTNLPIIDSATNLVISLE